LDAAMAAAPASLVPGRRCRSPFVLPLIKAAPPLLSSSGYSWRERAQKASISTSAFSTLWTGVHPAMEKTVTSTMTWMTRRRPPSPSRPRLTTRRVPCRPSEASVHRRFSSSLSNFFGCVQSALMLELCVAHIDDELCSCSWCRALRYHGCVVLLCGSAHTMYAQQRQSDLSSVTCSPRQTRHCPLWFALQMLHVRPKAASAASSTPSWNTVVAVGERKTSDCGIFEEYGCRSSGSPLFEHLLSYQRQRRMVVSPLCRVASLPIPRRLPYPHDNT